MNLEKLQEYREKSKLTANQIADLSGVPVSTVTKILSGSTANPNVDSLAPIVKVIGGSMDEIFDIQSPAPDFTTARDTVDRNLLEHVFVGHNQEKASFCRQINFLKRQLLVFQLACAVMVLFVIGVVIFDITHPTLGYVQYTLQAVTSALNYIMDMFTI